MIRVDRGHLVDEKTGEIVKDVGAGSRDSCPRAGSVLLETKYQRRIIVNTNCKTWECLSCRDRIRALFKMRVRTGVYRLGRCAFMTITYQAESKRLEDAHCVSKDWRELSRRLSRNEPEVRAMEWLRVMELTKKGVPHHHLVIGPVSGSIKCWPRNGFRIERYRARMGSCVCLAHKVARQWYEVTGDSYIVHTVIVTGAGGAGGYMSKYMGKEFDA